MSEIRTIPTIPTLPFDPAPVRERARIITLYVFLGLLVTIVLGAGTLNIFGRLQEANLLMIVSTFTTLFGTVIGFYFGQESARR
jgi:hypothetical protein